MNKKVSLTLVCLIYCELASAANPVSIPHTFQANTPAKAAEVNENFKALADAVENTVSTQGDTVNGDLTIHGNISVSGTVNGMSIGDSGQSPLLIGGIDAGKTLGLYSGGIGLPFQYESPPVIILTPGEPDNSGASHCRILSGGTYRISWRCFQNNASAAAEIMHWITVKPGVYNLTSLSGANRKMIAGIYDPTVNGDCVTCIIAFSESFSVPPIIVATVQEHPENTGPMGVKVTQFSESGMTLQTSSGGAGTDTAYRIHWIAVEPTSDDPIVLGRRYLYANSKEVTSNSGTINFPNAVKSYSSLVLTVEGGNSNAARIISEFPAFDSFVYYHHKENGAPGDTTALRINWIRWIDQ